MVIKKKTSGWSSIGKRKCTFLRWEMRDISIERRDFKCNQCWIWGRQRQQFYASFCFWNPQIIQKNPQKLVISLYLWDPIFLYNPKHDFFSFFEAIILRTVVICSPLQSFFQTLSLQYIGRLFQTQRWFRVKNNSVKSFFFISINI